MDAVVEGRVFDTIAARCTSDGARAWVSRVLRNHAQPKQGRTCLRPPVLAAGQEGALSADWRAVVEWMDTRNTDARRVIKVSAPQAYAAWQRDCLTTLNECDAQAGPDCIWGMARWQSGAGGKFLLDSRPGSSPSLASARPAQIVVEPCLGQWRLSLVDGSEYPSAIRHLLDCSGLDEAKGYADLVARHEREARLFEHKIKGVDIRIRSRAIPAVSIHVQTRAEYLCAYAYMDGMADQVGMCSIGITPVRARFVLGEPTTSGGSLLDKSVQRQGLGTEMYDLLDKLSGLPRVPHGKNGNTGFLSEMAEPFWQKRALTHRVPGYGDADVQARVVELEDKRRLIRLEQREFTPAHASFSLSVHQATGWPVEVLVSHYGNRIYTSWCRMPGGGIFNVHGVSSSQAVLERALNNNRQDDFSSAQACTQTLQKLSDMASRYHEGQDTDSAERTLEGADYIHLRHTGTVLPRLSRTLDALVQPELPNPYTPRM